MGYFTEAPYLGPGGCRAVLYLYKLIPAKQKSIFTEVSLPAGDQKQPQFYALCGTESWLKLLGSLCTSAVFFLKRFLEALLSEIRKQPPLTSFMIEISKRNQPLGNSKVHEIGSPDTMVGCDVGGQNLLNLGADHLVYLCTLQRVLCPVR